MANISEIKVGSLYTLAANKNAPETLVKVMSVKGRWVKVAAECNGAEANVAASQLTEFVAPLVETAETAKVTKSVVPASYRKAYITTKIDKVAFVDCGDQVATVLRGVELDEAFQLVANKIGIDVTTLVSQYSHLNPGMQRMCIGNRLRGFLANENKKAAK